jgi:hypothetical protein
MNLIFPSLRKYIKHLACILSNRKIMKFSIHIDECICNIKIRIETETNGGTMEGVSEFGVFQKSGSFDERRENMTIRWNRERPHGVE